MATLKQKKAIKLLSENPGMAVSRAMEKAGYSKLTSKSPKELTDSKAFQELFKEAIPDEELIKVHRAGLNAFIKRPEMVDRDENGKPIYEYVKQPDFHARHKYLDTAYKLRGRYTDEQESARPMTLNVINFHGTDSDRHTIQIRPKRLSASVPESDWFRAY